MEYGSVTEKQALEYKEVKEHFDKVNETFNL